MVKVPCSPSTLPLQVITSPSSTSLPVSSPAADVSSPASSLPLAADASELIVGAPLTPDSVSVAVGVVGQDVQGQRLVLDRGRDVRDGDRTVIGAGDRDRQPAGPLSALFVADY